MSRKYPMLKFLIFMFLSLPIYANSAIYGNYTAGCIKKSVPLTETSHLKIMRPQRNHFWGHSVLINYLNDLSNRVAQTPWNGLLVGDLSQKDGGPLVNGHASHQIGLDADLWLLPMPVIPLTIDEKKYKSAFSYVTPDMKIREPWGDLQRNFILSAAEDNRVERIFINAALKKDLCDNITPNSPHYAFLSKIRPWYGHDAHIHVRLKCPIGSNYCIPQAPPPLSSGCDASLNWWFSEEARLPVKNSSPPKKIILPEQCE